MDVYTNIIIFYNNKKNIWQKKIYGKKKKQKKIYNKKNNKK